MLANEFFSLISLSKYVILSIIISPNQARNLNGTMLIIFRPIFLKIFILQIITSHCTIEYVISRGKDSLEDFVTGLMAFLTLGQSSEAV